MDMVFIGDGVAEGIVEIVEKMDKRADVLVTSTDDVL